MDGARQRLLPVEYVWVGVGAAAEGQAGHRGSRFGAGISGGGEVDLIFWSLEVISLGYVFYEGKVQAHLISTLYPGLIVTCLACSSTKRVFSEHGMK